MATAPQPPLPLFYKDLMPLNSRDHAKYRINPPAGMTFSSFGSSAKTKTITATWTPTQAQAGQTVDVDVQIDASIEGLAGAAGLELPTVEALEAGATVTVWTAPAKVTLAAQAGEKGALAAARVVVKN